MAVEYKVREIGILGRLILMSVSRESMVLMQKRGLSFRGNDGRWGQKIGTDE